MGSERDNGDNDESKGGSGQETLSFAEFVHRDGPRLGPDRAALVLSEPDKGDQIFPLTRNLTVIGRSNNADLVLSDPAISDFHARILKHSFGYTVEDMGSAEGTFLGDRRVSHARLVKGDVLRLGNTALTFLNEPGNATKGPPPKTTPPMALVPVRMPPQDLAPRSTAMRDANSQGNLRHPYGSPDFDQDRRREIERQEPEPSFEDFLLKVIAAFRFVQRNARTISAFLGAGLVLSAISFRFFPPVRAAYSMITLYPAPKVNPIEPEGQRSQTDSMQFFAGVERAFISRDNLISTLKRIGVPNPSEAQADSVARRIKLENLGNNTYMATLTPGFFGRRDDSHVQLLDVHIKNYIESEIEKKLKVFVAEVDFLRAQADTAEKRLRDISDETVQLMKDNSALFQQRDIQAPGSAAELETRRIGLSGQIAQLAGDLAAVDSEMKRGTALRHPLDVRLQGYRDEVVTLERKLSELRAKGLADGHPDVQTLVAQIKDLQKTVSDHQNSEIPQFDKRSNPAYDALLSRADQIRAHLKAARSELGIVEESLSLRRKVSNESPKVNARMDELQRQKDEAIRQHGILFDRLKKAEVQLQLERVSAISRYEIVVPARLEAAPGRKALALRLALGLGLGILLTTLVLGIGELSKLVARVSQSSATMLLMLSLAGLLSQGCAHDERFTWVEDLPAKDLAAEPIVHPRDTILVEVVKQPTLSGEFVVRDDGHYTQPMVGSIQVAGQTPRQIANAIANALRDIVVNPVVSVWLTKPSPIRISVVGEVKTPGTYELNRDRSLSAVLAASGWLTEFAHSDRVFVIRAGSQDRIRFHVRDITTAEPHAAQFQMADADVVVVE